MKTSLVTLSGRHATAQERAEILRDYRSSGLTQREFAAARGMTVSTLGRWLRASPEVSGEEYPGTRVEFHSLALPASAEWAAEVQRSGGTTIRFQGHCPRELVEAVLKAAR